jgi:phosphate transport system protein
MDKTHTVKEYEEQLTELRQHLHGMAERVEDMITDAISALVDGDAERAESTVEDDRVVNHDEMMIDDLCIRILAKRQPMASDLRLLTTALKMVTDLERIGDLAVNISFEAQDQIDYDQRPSLDEIPQLARHVQWMVGAAIDSFIDRDPDLARDVINRDKEVNDLYADMNRRLIDYMRNNDEGIEAAMSIQRVAKHLERMGDHATNLGEKVIFMVEAEDVRHHNKIDEDWHHNTSANGSAV